MCDNSKPRKYSQQAILKAKQDKLERIRRASEKKDLSLLICRSWRHQVESRFGLSFKLCDDGFLTEIKYNVRQDDELQTD